MQPTSSVPNAGDWAPKRSAPCLIQSAPCPTRAYKASPASFRARPVRGTPPLDQGPVLKGRPPLNSSHPEDVSMSAPRRSLQLASRCCSLHTWLSSMQAVGPTTTPHMRRLMQWCVKVQAIFPALRKIQDFYERYGSVHQAEYSLSHFIHGMHTSCLMAWVSAISLMVSCKNHVRYCLTALYVWG